MRTFVSITLGALEKRKRIIGVAGLLLIVGIALRLVLGSSNAEVRSVAIDTLVVPESVDAGTTVTVEVTSGEDSGIAEVDVLNGFGRLSFTIPITDGTGQLDLPVSVSQQAGLVTLHAGDISEDVAIRPVDVAEVVAPLVGPRTIVADGEDFTLAVVFPVDRYGNQVADGTPVAIEWLQPTLPGAQAPTTGADVAVVDGMVWEMVFSGEIAGPTFIRTTSTTASGLTISGASIRIDEVPGIVSGIDLTQAQVDGVADGRSLIELETSRLVDAFGNELADGTIAHFVFDGPSGGGVVPGTVQNGVVRIEIIAPDLPGLLVGHLELQGQVSNDISINFVPAIASFEVHLAEVDGDVVVGIDSAIDPSGAFVADGTEVRWGDVRTQIRRGAAEIRLPLALVPEPVPAIEILGLEQPLDGDFS